MVTKVNHLTTRKFSLVVYQVMVGGAGPMACFTGDLVNFEINNHTPERARIETIGGDAEWVTIGTTAAPSEIVIRLEKAHLDYVNENIHSKDFILDLTKDTFVVAPEILRPPTITVSAPNNLTIELCISYDRIFKERELATAYCMEKIITESKTIVNPRF